MWVEKTKNGKFKFVERYTDYITGKSKKMSIVFEKDNASTRKLALESLTAMIKEKQTTEKLQEITFSELIEKYRLYQKSTVKASTYSRNYYACETLKSILGEDVLVNRLNAQYVKEKFLATSKSPGTLNEHRARLRGLVMWGFENDYINDVTWFMKFKPFKDESRKQKIKDKYMESYEIDLLLQHIQKSRCKNWYLVTKFLLQSGLRFGEFAALEKDDITDDYVKITKTYDFINNIITTPKTACSVRDVYVQPELRETIKSISLYAKMQQLSAGYGRCLIFLPGKEGTFIDYWAYEKFLKNNALKVLGSKITAHTLRHTHASILAAQGVSVDTIARRLGHENSKITRDVYLHVTEKLKELDNAAIDKTKIL